MVSNGTVWNTFGWFLDLSGDILGDKKSMGGFIPKMPRKIIEPRKFLGPNPVVNLLPFSHRAIGGTPLRA